MNVGVIGCGKVGLPLVAVLAQHHEVFAYDKDGDAIDAIQTLTSHIDEPLVQEYLNRHGPHIRYAQPAEMAACDTVFIIVPTPSKDDGSFSCEFVEQALIDLYPAAKVRGHLRVMLISTVSPGTCEALDKVIPTEIELIYTPTFIALGSVINDLETPKLQLVGTDRGRFTNIAPNLLHAKNIHYMSWEEAEIAKIAFNAYLTTKITYANGVAQLCHKYGANAERVLEAIGSDPRVGGTRYMHPGAGFGGPCFPRDNRAFTNALGDISLSSYLDWLNMHHAKFIANLAITNTSRPATFAILGDGYKVGSGYTIEPFGALIRDVFRSRYWTEVPVEEAATVVIAMPMDELPPISPGTVVIDVWRGHREQLGHCEYIAFGG